MHLASTRERERKKKQIEITTNAFEKELEKVSPRLAEKKDMPVCIICRVGSFKNRCLNLNYAL